MTKNESEFQNFFKMFNDYKDKSATVFDSMIESTTEQINQLEALEKEIKDKLARRRELYGEIQDNVDKLHVWARVYQLDDVTVPDHTPMELDASLTGTVLDSVENDDTSQSAGITATENNEAISNTDDDPMPPEASKVENGEDFHDDQKKPKETSKTKPTRKTKAKTKESSIEEHATLEPGQDESDAPAPDVAANEDSITPEDGEGAVKSEPVDEKASKKSSKADNEESSHAEQGPVSGDDGVDAKPNEDDTVVNGTGDPIEDGTPEDPAVEEGIEDDSEREEEERSMEDDTLADWADDGDSMGPIVEDPKAFGEDDDDEDWSLI